MDTETHSSLAIPDTVDMARITGVSDELLQEIRKSFSARITVRGNQIEIDGDPIEVKQATLLFSELSRMVAAGETPTMPQVHRMLALLKEAEYSPSELRDDVLLTYHGRAIRPKTAGQKRYVDAIRKNTITFGIGPAGTGKTYLACAMAVAALKRREMSRIIITRPVVEAGENLGFLPGTLMEKVDPYIRPLYDALRDMSDLDLTNMLIEGGEVELAPLAFMRGRTFNNSFVILDEAQNTTQEQMKMFLTRLGFGSKMVITGDDTQSDMPGGASGLRSARKILEGMDDIAFCDFSGGDVVRHSLVAKIVEAYARNGA